MEKRCNIILSHSGLEMAGDGNYNDLEELFDLIIFCEPIFLMRRIANIKTRKEF